jgi:Peptidase family M1 domain
MGEKIILDKWVAFFLPSPGPDKRNVGFIPNGRLTLILLTIISLLLFVSMRSSPRIQSKLRYPMRGRSDRFSTRCHTPKLLLVQSVAFTKIVPLMDGIVLRMLSKFVGEDKFLKGVSLYLKKHLYSNTVSRNLWEGIGEATGMWLPRPS